jgi:hypothetical protein
MEQRRPDKLPVTGSSQMLTRSWEEHPDLTGQESGFSPGRQPQEGVKTYMEGTCRRAIRPSFFVF